MTTVTPMRRRRLVGIDDLKPRLKSNYVVKGWLDRGATSVLFGESNTGKTFLAIDIAMHVAAGFAWQGHRVRQDANTPVVYLAAEGGGGIANRVAAMAQDRPQVAQQAAGHFTVLPDAIDLFDGTCGLSAGTVIEEIGTLIEPPALIVVDTFARAMGTGDENSAADMARFLMSVDAIRRATGAHIMLVHHTGKDGTKGARGSSALRAAVDTEIALTRSGDVATARATKQRDMISGSTFSYVLRGVSLGHDQDGDEVTSAVIDQVDCAPAGPQSAPRARISGRQEIALEALDCALKAFPNGGSEKDAKGTQKGTLDWATVPDWRSHCDRLKLSSGTGESSLRTAFHKVKKALVDKGLVEIKADMARRVSR